MTKLLSKFTLETHDYVWAHGRSHSFWIDKDNHGGHDTDTGFTSFPVFVFEALGDVQRGDRFEVERELVSEDEVVIRVKRLKPNMSNQPEVNPFSCKTIRQTAETRRLGKRRNVHDQKHYLSLRRYKRKCNNTPGHYGSTKTPVCCVLLDDGRVVDSWIDEIYKQDGMGYVECNGIPWPVPADRVFLIGHEPGGKRAA